MKDVGSGAAAERNFLFLHRFPVMKAAICFSKKKSKDW